MGWYGRVQRDVYIYWNDLDGRAEFAAHSAALIIGSPGFQEESAWFLASEGPLYPRLRVGLHFL